MGALDSPLEALALNYLTYGFLTVVNSIWAWVAVITAAVSFWRIRALSSPELLNAASCKAVATTEAAEEEEAIVTDAPTRGFCRVLERECSTKTKFRLYYEEEEAEDFRGDDGGESDDNPSEATAAEAGVSEKLDYCPRRRCDDWERTMVVMRMGDMGWYRWQDMNVLDGSVVRLWEGRRRR